MTSFGKNLKKQFLLDFDPVNTAYIFSSGVEAHLCNSSLSSFFLFDSHFPGLR